MPKRKSTFRISRSRKVATSSPEPSLRAPRRARTPPQSRPRPAKNGLTQGERTAISDGRMLETAVQLIHERGINNTTLKDIGELAGYSRGLASSRFGSKDALVLELLDRFNHRWKENSAAAVGLRTGLDAFRAANRGLIEFFRTEAKFIRVMYLVAYETVGTSEAMREQLAGQHEAYRHGIARWIRDGIGAGEVRKGTSPERIAVLYCSAVFGIIYQWLVKQTAIDCSHALDDLRENFLTLIAA